MNEEYIDIQVYDGDDETRYIKYEDMINLIEKIKIKQDEKGKEIERLNNTIKGLDNTIENLEEVIKHEDSIIKEAIEYIEERYNGEVLTHTFDKDNVGELLEILDKGE